MKYDAYNPPSLEDKLADELNTNELGKVNRDSIARSLRALGLCLVDRDVYDRLSWRDSPDRMGS